MSSDRDNELIYRLATGELDSVEEERAQALLREKPELAALLEEIRALQAEVRSAFPDPPPMDDQRAFVELMRRLSGSDSPVDPWMAREAEVGSRAAFDVGEPAFFRNRREDVRRTRFGIERSSMVRSERSEASTGAHLFHLRELARDDGLSVELEFYAGDVTTTKSEVLLVSAFAGLYHPTPGSVLGALADRYGISFASGPPADAVRHPGGLLHFRGVSCPAFDSLWVIELREPGRTFSIEDLRTSLSAIGARLPDMLTDASSITLPLLGTGTQGLNPRDVARELLSALPRWARVPRLRAIRMFTMEWVHIAALNRALDDRAFNEGSSLWYMVRRELSVYVAQGLGSEPVRAALKDLLQIVSAPAPSLRSVALEGRRIAEAVLRHLSGDRDASASERADWITPDLRLLIEHGRAAAAGGAVDEHDAVLIVRSALRAAERTSV